MKPCWRDLFNALLLCCTVFLTACGGGGGTTRPAPSDPSPPPSSPPPPPPPEPSDENFDTPEFRRSGSLDNIRALAAYEAGASGEGITVATVDTGVDLEHPDLVGNISPLSADVVPERAATADDEDGHGTLVAGIIAARRNDAGTLGVAFDAQILATRAESPGTCMEEEGDCSFFDDDIARGVRYSVENGARVINISLGGEGFGFNTLQAVQQAAAEDVLVIISAGNDGEVDPSGFAFLARDPDVQGHVLVVGATDNQDNLASFSNQAGALAEFFLVAPGAGIVAPFRTAECSPGTALCLARASGTSFASPHVAGAVALLAQAFPNLSGLEISEILRETATDLGDPGVDNRFGHGLLNLEAAFQPVGVTSIPTDEDGGGAMPVEGATMASGAAFGDALTVSGALDGILITDKYARNFRTDLSTHIDPAPQALSLQSLVSHAHYLDGGRVRLGGGTHARLSAFEDRFQEIKERLNPLGFAYGGADRPAAYLTQDLGKRSQAALAYGISPNRLLQSGQFPGPERGFALDRRTATPFFARAGDTRSVLVRHRLSNSAQLDFLAAQTQREGRLGSAERRIRQSELLERRARSFVTQLGLRLGPAALRFRAAVDDEQNSFLGTEAGGALQIASGARSWILAFDGTLPLSDTLSLFTQYLTAFADLESGHSAFVRDPGKVRAQSFSIGFEARDVWKARDRLGFLITQPLRVSGGGARLRLPTNYDYAQERYLFEDRVLGFAPSGREIDLEARYGVNIGTVFDVQASVIQQFNAGHIAGGAEITSFLLRLNARF